MSWVKPLKHPSHDVSSLQASQLGIFRFHVFFWFVVLKTTDRSRCGLCQWKGTHLVTCDSQFIQSFMGMRQRLNRKDRPSHWVKRILTSYCFSINITFVCPFLNKVNLPWITHWGTYLPFSFLSISCKFLVSLVSNDDTIFTTGQKMRFIYLSFTCKTKISSVLDGALKKKTNRLFRKCRSLIGVFVVGMHKYSATSILCLWDIFVSSAFDELNLFQLICIFRTYVVLLQNCYNFLCRHILYEFACPKSGACSSVVDARLV